jgi:hypothetical protein
MILKAKDKTPSKWTQVHCGKKIQELRNVGFDSNYIQAKFNQGKIISPLCDSLFHLLNWFGGRVFSKILNFFPFFFFFF